MQPEVRGKDSNLQLEHQPSGMFQPNIMSSNYDVIHCKARTVTQKEQCRSNYDQRLLITHHFSLSCRKGSYFNRDDQVFSITCMFRPQQLRDGRPG